MTNDEIRDAIKIMRQREHREISAGKCAIMLDLIDEAEAMLSGAATYDAKYDKRETVRQRAEIERDIERELTR